MKTLFLGAVYGFTSISRGTEEKVCGNSRGSIKKEVEFSGMLAKNSYGVEFPRVLILDVGISKRYHTILQNFQG